MSAGDNKKMSELAAAATLTGTELVELVQSSANVRSTLAALLLANLPAAHPTVKFPAIQVPSSDANTLDDYEEGTWTPAFTLTGTAFGSIGYSTQDGVYEKIGRQVRAFGHITVNALTVGAASGNLTISGLPFAAGTSGAPVTIGFISSFTGNTPIHGLVSASSIVLYHRTAITGGAVTSTFSVVSSTSDIYFSTVYNV